MNLAPHTGSDSSTESRGGVTPQGMANLLWALVHLDSSCGYAGRSSRSSSSSIGSSMSGSSGGIDSVAVGYDDIFPGTGTNSRRRRRRRSSSSGSGKGDVGEGGQGGGDVGVGMRKGIARDAVSGGVSMEQWLQGFWSATMPGLAAWPSASLAVVAVCLARAQVCVCV